ncbi:MAG: PAS domain S-box protein [Azospirillum sp.]|nr:PAS domain S-box protein [Azospirillum sp.]
MAEPKSLTGVQRTFNVDEFLVSKTDKTGRLTYANDVFIKISGYTEMELLGHPHNIVRHPNMPRAVFKLMWDRIGDRKEIFAYVVNRSKNGDHYWVFAHVTPSLGGDGSIRGYHSNRRIARPAALAAIQPVYDRLLNEERQHTDPKAGLNASSALLVELVRRTGTDNYDQFVLGLQK